MGRKKIDTHADFTNHWVVETSLNVTEAMLQQPAGQYSASIWVRVDDEKLTAGSDGRIQGDASLDRSILYFSVDENGMAVWKSWNSSGEDRFSDPMPVTVGEEQRIKIEYNNGTITQMVNDVAVKIYGVDSDIGTLSAPTSLIIQS